MQQTPIHFFVQNVMGRSPDNTSGVNRLFSQSVQKYHMQFDFISECCLGE